MSTMIAKRARQVAAIILSCTLMMLVVGAGPLRTFAEELQDAGQEEALTALADGPTALEEDLAAQEEDPIAQEDDAAQEEDLAAQEDTPAVKNERTGETYVKLNDALYAAELNDTLTLLRDTSDSIGRGYVTLDLGGHTLTIAPATLPWYGNTESVTGIVIDSGTITIQNGTIVSDHQDTVVAKHYYATANGTVILGKDLTLKCSSSALQAQDNGKIVIDGATVVCTDEERNAAFATGGGLIEVKSGSITQSGSSMATMSAKSGGRIVVNGGKVRSEASTALAATGDGTSIIVESGEVSNSGKDLDGNTGVDGPWVGFATEKGKIIVKGGTVRSDAANGLYAYNSDKVDDHQGHVEISGGNVSAASGYALFSCGGSCTATVSGGTITGNVLCGTASLGSKDSISISGGTIDGTVDCQGEGCSLVATGGTFTRGLADAYVDKRCRKESTNNASKPDEVKVIMNPWDVTIDPIDSCTFDMKSHEPTVTVRRKDGSVVPPSDYDVTYADNVFGPDAKVTVTCKTGEQAGMSKSTTFKIYQLAPDPLTPTDPFSIKVDPGDVFKHYGTNDPELFYVIAPVDGIAGSGTLAENHRVEAHIYREPGERAGTYQIFVGNVKIYAHDGTDVTELYDIRRGTGTLTIHHPAGQADDKTPTAQGSSSSGAGSQKAGGSSTSRATLPATSDEPVTARVLFLASLGLLALAAGRHLARRAA